MNLLQRIFGSKPSDGVSAAPLAPAAPQAMAGTSQTFYSMNDPALLEFIRTGVEGGATESGATITVERALRNMAVMRSCRLISNTIGALPFHVYEKGSDDKKIADTHPVHKLMHVRPNSFQRPKAFKSTMQLRALVHGNAYARVTWLGNTPVSLVPLESTRVEPKLTDSWEMVYEYTKPNGEKIILKKRDIFHISDLSLDGVAGMSRVKLAAEAIGLALQAEKAAARLFRNGMMVGGALEHPGNLSDEAHTRLRTSMEERYSGADNAHRWIILEEGLKAAQFAQKASDSQHVEQRAHQIEEIARCFDIPRPLLMMDDTSWGSGIEQLALFFIQYGLATWFVTWEEAVMDLFSNTEAERYFGKFNEGALLRGTLKDQAEFFAKALGSGGHAPWMKVNEIRDLSDLSKDEDPASDKLPKQAVKQPTEPKEPNDEPPAKPAKPAS